MSAYYLVAQRPRDWRDWAQEADYAIAHGAPDIPATPKPIDLFPGEDPSFGPLAPVKDDGAGSKGDSVAKVSSPSEHLLWDSRAKTHDQDPLLYNYPMNLPRDVNDAFSHMLSNPTVLSAHIVEQPAGNPFARPQVPLAQATNWPAADARYTPAQLPGNAFAQSPYAVAYYAQPSLVHTPAAATPAILPAPAPEPAPHMYVPYVNNINGPREPKPEAGGEARQTPQSPTKTPKKTPKADPHAGAAAKENKAAASTPASKPMWMAASAAPTPRLTKAYTPQAEMFSWTDTAFPAPTPPQARGMHPAQRVDPMPSMRAELRGAMPVQSQLKKTPKARVDPVDRMDQTDPHGRAWHHSGPFDHMSRGHQRSRSETHPTPTVRFADQPVFAPPPSPTQQLETLVSRVQSRQSPASFADLYATEHHGRPPPTGTKKRGGLFSSAESDAGASTVLGFGFASPSHVHAQPAKKGKGFKHGAAR